MSAVGRLAFRRVLLRQAGLTSRCQHLSGGYNIRVATYYHYEANGTPKNNGHFAVYSERPGDYRGEVTKPQKYRF